MTLINLLDVTLILLRRGFFAVAMLVAIICAVDWLVRTRRLSPFGVIARFMRANVDPAIAPIERAVVRAGGVPSSAPWWALVVVVLSGIVVISVLDFLRGQVELFMRAVDGGPRGIYQLVVSLIFALLQLAIIVRVVISWIRVRPRSWIARWSFKLTEPMLRPLRQVIPTFGAVDITPIVAWFLLSLLETFFKRLG